MHSNTKKSVQRTS